MKRCAVFIVVMLAAACGGNEPSVEDAPRPSNPLIGSWLMFGGSTQGLYNKEGMDKEESILVLADSSYSLTYRRNDLSFVFVETGKVSYDRRKQRLTFLVTSSSGLDWSDGEPRKLLEVPDLVPFERQPGQEYRMQYALDDSLMQLSASDVEDSWFIRMPQ